MDDLKHIIKQCCKNKAKSQKLLYDTFAPYMFSVCLQYCNDRSEAEDFLQESFIKIFSNIKQYKFTGSFQGWMRRIVVNTILATYRQKNPVFLSDNIEIYEDSAYDISEEQISPIDTNELQKIVSDLPPKYRLVFNLYALEGYCHNEISEILNISVGTSKSNLSRARKILKSKILEKKTTSNFQTA